MTLRLDTYLSNWAYSNASSLSDPSRFVTVCYGKALSISVSPSSAGAGCRVLLPTGSDLPFRLHFSWRLESRSSAAAI